MSGALSGRLTRRRIRTGFVAVALITQLGPALAAEFSGYLTLTTDYVFRGVSYSDPHGAAQIGADLDFVSGLYLGAWGSTIDIGDGSTVQRDLEFDYYLGLDRPIADRWTLGARVVAYTFPGTTGPYEYDYEEYSAVVNYDDRAWLEYSYSPDLYHSGYATHNVEAYGEWLLPAQLVFSAGAGYYDVSALSGEGYAYWTAGLTRSIGRFDLDLRYHDTDRVVPIISSPDRAGARLAFSVRIQF